MDGMEAQLQKARLSIREGLESTGNLTDERFAQPEKEFAPRISTEPGMQTDESIEQSQNEPISSTERWEWGSKATAENWVNERKQSRQRTPTEDGIKTETRIRPIRFSLSLPSIFETSKTVPSQEMRERGQINEAQSGTEQ
jgi:hypothetical protein